VSAEVGGRRFAEPVRRNNDELADMGGGRPDHFAGFVAATPLADPDASAAEAMRAVGELGALGVQLEEDSVNLPLHEHRYAALWQALAELGAGA
jgi:predicted TIM-barrel fold metal-dependent hydrolase